MKYLGKSEVIFLYKWHKMNYDNNKNRYNHNHHHDN